MGKFSCKTHSSWDQFFSSRIKKELDIIHEKISNWPFEPNPERVLRFATVDLENINIVILGRDPYFQPSVATGRAFEVAGIKSWKEKFPQHSLKGIVKLIYKTYYGQEASYEDIKKSLDAIKLSPPDRLFKEWEQQGVLLLNTALTCQTGKAGSHQKLWENFTKELIHFIDTQRPNAYWFLWGGYAKGFESEIKNGITIKASHPMLHQKFLKSDCLERTSHLVDWRGI